MTKSKPNYLRDQLGELLRDKRERRRVSLERLAEQTHIKLSHLIALEANQFDQLPAAVFVRGYIKSYGQVLGFDYRPLQAILRRDFKESSRGQLVPREFVKPLVGSGLRLTSRLTMISSVLVLFIVGLFYLGWRYFQMLQPPEISIFEPAENEVIAAKVQVIGETEPEAVLTINDQPVSLRPSGEFTTEVVFMTEGLALIKIEAVDPQGKKSELTRSVYVKF